MPGSGRSPGEGHGNPLQYSCLENPHGQRSLVGYSPQVTESDMTERLSTHSTAAFKFFLFFNFWLCRVTCGILVPQSEIEPEPLAVKAQSLNCWITKEFPQVVLKNR